MKKLLSVLLAVSLVAVLFGMTACGGSAKTVNLIYVEWSSEIASTHVVKAVLEMAGYNVEMTPVSAAAMWKGISTGDADAMVAAWLPTTHGHYLKKVSENVENLGRN